MPAPRSVGWNTRKRQSWIALAGGRRTPAQFGVVLGESFVPHLLCHDLGVAVAAKHFLCNAEFAGRTRGLNVLAKSSVGLLLWCVVVCHLVLRPALGGSNFVQVPIVSNIAAKRLTPSTRR